MDLNNFFASKASKLDNRITKFVLQKETLQHHGGMQQRFLYIKMCMDYLPAYMLS